jgi:DegV family protein with EDD domain
VAVRILVDSTADIPPERARALDIEVVALTVHFGEETYRDGVDLDGRAFYHKLVSGPKLPTTSTPPPGLFLDAYRKLIAGGADAVLALHLGADLSGTYSNSSVAAETVTSETGVPIAVLDSRQVSGGFGLPAEILAAEARQGAGLDQLKAHAASLFSRMRLYAVLDTLEFLKRGGRIGGAKAFLGTMLQVKPILEVKDSRVVAVEQPRTRAKAQERIGQLIKGLGPLEALGIAKSDDQIGEQLLAVARTFWQGDVEMFALGAVVGTHAGPGAGALIALTKEPETPA